RGLIVTDAMNMKGVTGSRPPGIADKDAIIAGNDVLEFTEDVSRAISEIRRAIREGRITQQTIDEKCRKMLALKHWAGLDQFQPLPTAGLHSDLNAPEFQSLRRSLSESSLTVLQNKDDIIP